MALLLFWDMVSGFSARSFASISGVQLLRSAALFTGCETLMCAEVVEPLEAMMSCVGEEYVQGEMPTRKRAQDIAIAGIKKGL